MTLIVLFFILKELNIEEIVISIVLLMLTFSPLVLFFGWKAQLEPFLISVFLLSQFHLIRFIKRKGKESYLYIASILVGVLIASRSNFLIFTFPFVVLAFVSRTNINLILKRAIISLFFMIIGIIGTVLPSQVLYPQYDPIKFLYHRIFGAGKYAFASGNPLIRHHMLTFIDDALWKQITMLLPLSIASLFILKRYSVRNELKIYIMLLFMSTFTYYLLTYIHVANHIYHTYYGIPLFAIASAITLNYIYNKIVMHMRSRIISMALLILIVITSFLSSYHYARAYYGIFTDKIYDKMDPYGTYESYVVGILIRYILDELENPSGYLLVQSPTVYYPTYHAAITYHKIYKWDEEIKDYIAEYSFFNNQLEFLKELKNRNVILLTITPDVYRYASKAFWEYIKQHFVEICYTRNFVIALNKTLFEKNPAIKLKCITFLFNLLKNDKLAFKTIYSNKLQILNYSLYLWRDFKKLGMIYLNHTMLSLLSPKINMLRNNFTIVVFLYINELPLRANIVSKDNIWKIKFGASKEIYLETPCTPKGYGWLKGVYYEPYLYLPVCVTIKYSTADAGIYINGVKMSRIYYVIRNGSRIATSPPNLPVSEGPLLLGCDKFSGWIKVLIFNKPLSEKEISMVSLLNMSEVQHYLIFSYP